MEKLRPNSEIPQFRRLNQALALYIKSALNVVPLTPENPNRNLGQKQTIDFTLGNSAPIDFVYFYYWPKDMIPPPDEEDIFFIDIQYIDGGGRSFSFTPNGEVPIPTSPRYPRPSDYELIDYCFYSLNREYPQYFPNFREFELAFYEEGDLR